MSVLYAISRVWPQQWWPAAVLLTMQALALPILFAGLLWRLRRGSWATAIAAVGFCLWPGLLVVETWFSAGLELFWLTGAFVVAHLVLLGRLWATWAASGVLLCSAMFNERALFTLPLVLTVLLLFDTPTASLRDRLSRVARDYGTAMLALAGTTAAVLVGILVRTGDARSSWGEMPDPTEAAVGAWRLFVEGAARNLLLLPSAWAGERGTFPDSPPVWQVAAVVGVVSLAWVWAWRTNRTQAVVSVALVSAWVMVEASLLLWSRSDFLDDVSSNLLLDPRYALATSVVVLLVIGAFPCEAGSTKVAGRAAVTTVAVASILGLHALVAVGTMSDGSPAQAWLDKARASFVGEGKPPLVSTASPGFMLNTFFLGVDERGKQYEQGTTRTLLDVGDARPEFGRPTDFPLGLDENADAVMVTVEPVRSSTTPGYGANCSVQVGTAWVEVPMSPTGLGNPVLAVDVLGQAAGGVQVRVGDYLASANLAPGLRSLYFFPPPGDFDGYSIRTVDRGESICVGGARAGRPSAG